MKRKLHYFVIIGLSFAMTGAAVIVHFCLNKEPASKELPVKELTVGEFDMADHQEAIEYFPSDKNVGQVNDGYTAIEKAKELWLEKYSIINGRPEDPLRGIKGYEVFFDQNNDCWLVQTIWPRYTKGCTFRTIIQTDGKVIAVWYD